METSDYYRAFTACYQNAGTLLSVCITVLGALLMQSGTHFTSFTKCGTNVSLREEL